MSIPRNIGLVYPLNLSSTDLDKAARVCLPFSKVNNKLDLLKLRSRWFLLAAPCRTIDLQVFAPRL